MYNDVGYSPPSEERAQQPKARRRGKKKTERQKTERQDVLPSPEDLQELGSFFHRNGLPDIEKKVKGLQEDFTNTQGTKLTATGMKWFFRLAGIVAAGIITSVLPLGTTLYAAMAGAVAFTFGAPAVAGVVQELSIKRYEKLHEDLSDLRDLKAQITKANATEPTAPQYSQDAEAHEPPPKPILRKRQQENPEPSTDGAFDADQPPAPETRIIDGRNVVAGTTQELNAEPGDLIDFANAAALAANNKRDAA